MNANENGEEIKRRVALMKELCSKRTENTESICKAVQRLVSLWGELAAAGATLIGGNHDVKQAALGKSEKLEMWLKNEGISLLKAVVTTRSRLQKVGSQIQAQAEEIVNLFDRTHGDEGEITGGLASLLDMSIPPAFLTELNSDAFDDLVSQVAASHTTSLNEELGKFDKQCKDSYKTKGGEETDDFFHAFGKFGNNYWADGLSSDCDKTLEEVYQLGQATILNYLPGRVMKSFTVFAEKAGTYLKIDKKESKRYIKRSDKQYQVILF